MHSSVATRHASAAAAFVVVAVATALSGGCSADRACIEQSQRLDTCPSRAEAAAFMDSVCGRVRSVDSEGERTSDGLCCYDVSYDDSEQCVPTAPAGSGPAPAGASAVAATGAATSSSSGGGACDNLGFCSSCATCAEAGNCADEKLACDSNASCATLRTCVEGCPQNDQTCVDNCVAGHQQGVSDLDALYRCILCEECVSDCAAASSGC
jgi:hypothetical protein